MKRCVVFAVMACLSLTTTSRAMPPDSPDIVYIDGSPCNRLCQAYMAWSREQLYGPPQHSPDIRRPIAGPPVATPRPAIRNRIAKPTARDTAKLHTDSAGLQQRTTDKQPASGARPAAPQAAKQAGVPEAAQSKASDSTQTGASPPNQAEASAASSTSAPIRALVVVAAAAAEQSTLAALGSSEATSASSADHKTDEPAEPNAKTLVALLISRPDIKSVAELAGKDVAVDDRQSASEDRVKIALVAAGATEVQLSDGATKAIDRLLGGEVPAAVVTLASPDAAAEFPDIAGFTVFKLPLAPR